MLTDKEIIAYAVNAYGFLIPIFSEVTFAEFGQMIRCYYDCERNTKNRCIAEVLEHVTGTVKNKAGSYSATITGRI